MRLPYQYKPLMEQPEIAGNLLFMSERPNQGFVFTELNCPYYPVSLDDDVGLDISFCQKLGCLAAISLTDHLSKMNGSNIFWFMTYDIDFEMGFLFDLFF